MIGQQGKGATNEEKAVHINGPVVNAAPSEANPIGYQGLGSLMSSVRACDRSESAQQRNRATCERTWRRVDSGIWSASGRSLRTTNHEGVNSAVMIKKKLNRWGLRLMEVVVLNLAPVRLAPVSKLARSYRTGPNKSWYEFLLCTFSLLFILQ